jgi:hypothetical protein
MQHRGNQPFPILITKVCLEITLLVTIPLGRRRVRPLRAARRTHLVSQFYAIAVPLRQNGIGCKPAVLHWKQMQNRQQEITEK